MVLLVSCFNWT